jgi:hypothetical protein
MRSCVICSASAISPICSDCGIVPVLSLQTGLDPFSDNVALVVKKVVLGQVSFTHFFPYWPCSIGPFVVFHFLPSK